MAKYIVYLTTTASTSVEVEAEDVDAAIDAAYDKDMPTLSAEASGWGHDWSLDLSDVWDVSSVGDEAGNVVHEERQAQAGDNREALAAEIERVVGGYPGNEVQRPKTGVGEFLNDAQWAAKIVREG